MFVVTVKDSGRGIDVTGSFTYGNDAMRWFAHQVGLDTTSTVTVMENDRVIMMRGGRAENDG